MTQQNTNTLKFEIKRFIDVIGFNFLNTSWLDKLSEESKSTLSEYCFDAPSLTKREVAMMLYSDQDDKLWSFIMGR